MFARRTYRELFEQGCRREDSVANSVMQGYTVVVMYQWRTGRAFIMINVLFDPEMLRNSKEMIARLVRRNKPARGIFARPYEWTNDSMGSVLEFHTLSPSRKR